jgi:hypothetical protein
MSNRRPCHFHQRPGGCKRGGNCAFSHDSPSSSGIENLTPLSRGSNSSANIPRAPPGICNDFWATGKCSRNFDCRYRHEQRGNMAPLGRQAMIMPETDGLDAGQVHNRLIKFLKDDFRFQSCNEIYAFVKLLGCASKDNNWVCYVLFSTSFPA